jgi:transcriptional regulator with XRE-family HTH domain
MSVVSRKRLLEKLSNREYRAAYAEESVKTSLPFQIKAIREERNWSQQILGKKVNMKQNAISRLESAEYGNLNINTLLRLADTFDCGLLVKFVPFSRLLEEFEDVSPTALSVQPFADDCERLELWASEWDTTNAHATETHYGVNSNTTESVSLIARYQDYSTADNSQRVEYVN